MAIPEVETSTASVLLKESDIPGTSLVEGNKQSRKKADLLLFFLLRCRCVSSESLNLKGQLVL
jgi:hypothetical protein